MPQQKSSLASLACKQFKDNAWRDFQDEAAVEQSVLVTLEGSPPKRLWAFPEHLDELALGHALVDLCPKGVLPAILKQTGNDFALGWTPGELPPPAPWPAAPLEAHVILRGAAAFMAMAGRWEATGCFHRAAVYDPATGEFVRHVEDIGRHNCLDRLAGWALLQGYALAGRVLFVSARATASLVGKAVRCGYAAMISRSAVTTAGVEAARAGGLSLVGFSRENRFSVFADPKGRIRCAP